MGVQAAAPLALPPDISLEPTPRARLLIDGPVQAG
jgi:hypothetical protein